MNGQVSRGSAGEYQADEWAGIAWTSWLPDLENAEWLTTMLRQSVIRMNAMS